MELQEFKSQWQNKSLGYGKLVRAKWQSESANKEGIKCLKVSEGVVRFAHYANINGVVVKGGDNTNNETLIDSVLKFNPNTNNYLVQLTLDINDNHKVATQYYQEINGAMVEISKQDYETLNPKKASAHKPTIVFYKKLQDLIAIGY